MHGGEEQFLEGMLDWDGIPNRKYDEYRRIAAEFKKIGQYFPYKPRAEIGLAFSFPSVIAGGYFSEQHQQQLESCFGLFAYRNMDTRIVDVARSALDYKLLFLPGISVMDTATAGKVRDFVKRGGTVVMTGNSSVVDETGKVFSSAHPGLLADVSSTGRRLRTNRRPERSYPGGASKVIIWNCRIKGRRSLPNRPNSKSSSPEGRKCWAASPAWTGIIRS